MTGGAAFMNQVLGWLHKLVNFCDFMGDHVSHLVLALAILCTASSITSLMNPQPLVWKVRGFAKAFGARDLGHCIGHLAMGPHHFLAHTGGYSMRLLTRRSPLGAVGDS